MSLLAVINRVADHQPQDFIAPVPSRSTSVFVVQDNIPYRFNLSVSVPGWYVVHPVSKKRAEVLSQADEWQRLRFLEALPRFYCIVLAVMGDVCIAAPYNISDANQRGWKNGEPSPIYLTEGARPSLFDVAVARRLGGILYFDRLNTSYIDEETIFSRGGITAEMKPENVRLNSSWANAYAFVYQRMLDEQKELQKKMQEDLKLKSKSDVEYHLNFMGASLLTEETIGNRIAVTYTYGEHTHRLVVDKNMRLVTAGICLDGTESDHNLSSAVAVIERAYELNRFDLPGNVNRDEDYDDDDDY